MSTAKAEFSPGALAASLDAVLPRSASGALCVAFSGGLDSTVLLTSLAALLSQHPQWSLRAIHLDHQLQSDSAQWQRECAEVAAGLGVPFEHAQLNISSGGEGLEAAARGARYDALRERLRPGETLLTAHHADDQLETVLLALLRGAGVRGLAAMPDCAAFGAGWHARALLKFTRQQLYDWAMENQLKWLEDPSNAHSTFSRNYLRNDIVPLLTARWPAAALNAQRTTHHLADAATLLDELAALDLQDAAVAQCLSVEKLAALSRERRRNLLRFWLRERGLRAPSTRKLISLEHDMIAAQGDRNPCAQWEGAQVRRHRGLLYAIAVAQADPPAPIATDWNWHNDSCPLGEGLGMLQAVPSVGSGLAVDRLPAIVQVRSRGGAERLHLAGRTHDRPLKDLLRESGVLPWWRDRLPLICIDGKAIAVADLMIAQAFAAQPGEAAIDLLWCGKPHIQCVEQVLPGE